MSVGGLESDVMYQYKPVAVCGDIRFYGDDVKFTFFPSTPQERRAYG